MSNNGAKKESGWVGSTNRKPEEERGWGLYSAASSAGIHPSSLPTPTKPQPPNPKPQTPDPNPGKIRRAGSTPSEISPDLEFGVCKEGGGRTRQRAARDMRLISCPASAEAKKDEAMGAWYSAEGSKAHAVE